MDPIEIDPTLRTLPSVVFDPENPPADWLAIDKNAWVFRCPNVESQMHLTRRDTNSPWAVTASTPQITFRAERMVVGDITAASLYAAGLFEGAVDGCAFGISLTKSCPESDAESDAETTTPPTSAYLPEAPEGWSSKAFPDWRVVYTKEGTLPSMEIEYEVEILLDDVRKVCGWRSWTWTLVRQGVFFSGAGKDLADCIDRVEHYIQMVLEKWTLDPSSLGAFYDAGQGTWMGQGGLPARIQKVPGPPQVWTWRLKDEDEGFVLKPLIGFYPPSPEHAASQVMAWARSLGLVDSKAPTSDPAPTLLPEGWRPDPDTGARWLFANPQAEASVTLHAVRPPTGATYVMSLKILGERPYVITSSMPFPADDLHDMLAYVDNLRRVLTK